MKIRAAQTTNPSAFLVNGNQDIVAAGRGAVSRLAAQLICIAVLRANSETPAG